MPTKGVQIDRQCAVVLAKAVELFILDITSQAWLAARQKTPEQTMLDVAQLRAAFDMSFFDFMHDIDVESDVVDDESNDESEADKTQQQLSLGCFLLADQRDCVVGDVALTLTCDDSGQLACNGSLCVSFAQHTARATFAGGAIAAHRFVLGLHGTLTTTTEERPLTNARLVWTFNDPRQLDTSGSTTLQRDGAACVVADAGSALAQITLAWPDVDAAAGAGLRQVTLTLNAFREPELES